MRIFDFGPSIDLGRYSTWEITSFVLGDKTYVAQDFGVEPTIRFDPDEKKIYGNTGCNTFFANYEWINDEAIEMRGSGMTRKMCSQNAVVFEQKMMEEFDGDFEIKDKDDTIILKGENLTINLKGMHKQQHDGEE